MAKPIVMTVLANGSQARRELAVTGRSASALGDRGRAFGRVFAGGVAIAGVAVGAFALKSVKAASDAQQSIGATETVFGRFSKSVIRDSNSAARAYGLSANTYRENANIIGSLFKNQGVSTDKLASKTKSMISTAADLSATFGGSTTDAVEALSSAFKGEFDPLEKYGISIKQSTVNTEAQRLATAKYHTSLTKLSTAQQTALKQQATSNLITKQSSSSLGAFKSETGTLAHQQQVLGAQFDNIKVKLGTYLLPILTKFFTFLNNDGPAAFTVVSRAIAPVIGFFQSFGQSSVAGSTEMSTFLTTVQSVWTSVKGIFASAVVIVTVLWTTFGSTIVSNLRSTFANVMLILRGAFKIIQGIFDVVAGILTGDWSRVWKGIKEILSGAVKVLAGIVRELWNRIVTAFKLGAITVKGIFKGLGSALVDAGRAIIGGLIRGITEKLSDLYDKVKGIGSKIKSLKGPLSYDKVMLKPEGQAIIQGLIDGIAKEEKNLYSKVSSISKNLANTSLTLGSPSANISSSALQLVGAGAPTTVNITVHAPVGSSPQDIGRELDKNLQAFYGKRGGRR